MDLTLCMLDNFSCVLSNTYEYVCGSNIGHWSRAKSSMQWSVMHFRGLLGAILGVIRKCLLVAFEIRSPNKL